MFSDISKYPWAWCGEKNCPWFRTPGLDNDSAMEKNKTEIGLNCVLGGPVEVLNNPTLILTNFHLYEKYRNPYVFRRQCPSQAQVFSQLCLPASNLTQYYAAPVVEVRTDVPGQFKGPGYGPIHQWKMP